MLEAFIPTLAKQQISAVFIKPHQYIKVIPNYMLEQANQYHIPLIELNAEIRFSAITKEISDLLIERQTEILRNIMSVNRLLTNIIINGAELKEIVHIISDLSHSSVLIIDVINNRQTYEITPSASSVFSGLNITDIIQTFISHSHMHEIRIEHTIFGYLYLYETEQSSYIDVDVLKQILNTIPLEITKTQSILATRNDGLSNFILHLLSDQIINEDWEIARAEKLGFQINDYHTIMQLRITYKPEYRESIYKFQEALLLNQINTLFTNLGVSTQLIHSSLGLIIVLTYPETLENQKSYIKQLQEFLFAQSPSTYNALEIKIGCSNTHKGVFGIVQGNREATIAFQAACNSRQALLHFDDLGILRFIYSDNAEYEISLFIKETLGELLDINQERNLELLDTLECYLRNQGNMKRISAELFTHYNTISYRLKNIQKLLGMDLHNSSDRFRLELALNLFHSTIAPEK